MIALSKSLTDCIIGEKQPGDLSGTTVLFTDDDNSVSEGDNSIKLHNNHQMILQC